LAIEARAHDESKLAASGPSIAWLLRLRSWALATQIAVGVSVEAWLSFGLPWTPLVVVFCVEAVTNVALWLWQRRTAAVPERAIIAVMVLDTLLLSALLVFTGGPLNPFTFLYLVHVALGALVLSPVASWSLTAVTLACYGALFFVPSPPIGAHDPHAGHGHAHARAPGAELEAGMQIHVQGMWFACAVTAVFVAGFIHRVRASLRARDAELARAQAMRERQERVTAMGQVAAGAAHELGTPLSTIAVASRELARALEVAAPEHVADALLIRAQVQRCQGILSQMQLGTGSQPGEAQRSEGVRAIVERALDEGEARARVRWRDGLEDASVLVPVSAVVRAVRSLVDNALWASPADAPVELSLRRAGRFVEIEIADHGEGMSEDVLRRAGEPFFTTREPGVGMGLGLYLARNLAEQLGGALVLQSAPGEGTRAILRLPAQPVGERRGGVGGDA
jgi:two-component system sensor histidine kinase RegB